MSVQPITDGLPSALLLADVLLLGVENGVGVELKSEITISLLLTC
jgi:hypothetical protein